MTQSELRLKNLEQFNNCDSLYAPVQNTARIVPDCKALRFMGKNIKYKRLVKEVDKFAAALKAAGIKRGEAVTFALPNIPESVYLLYAASSGGFIASPLHPLSTPAEVKAAVEKSGSRIIFALADAAEGIAAALSTAAVIAVNPVNSLKITKLLYSIKHRMPRESDNLITLKSFLKGKPIKFTSQPTLGNPHTAVLLQSGGTTGTPKVIELGYESVNNLAAKGLDILGIDSVTKSGMLSVLPVFHGFGLAMGIHAMLTNGGKNVIMPKFHRAEAIREIKRGHAQFIIGVPRIYEALLSHSSFDARAVKKLITAFVGGDFVAQSLLEKFDSYVAACGGSCRLFEGYGLTETVTVCSVNTSACNRQNTVGKPIKNLSIAAFDLSCAPRMLPPLNKGELCVSGDTLMNGYLGDEQATAQVFFNYDGKRFVRTGDCGYCDADGFVYFLSRYKRIIKVRGVPVYPMQIEQLCLSVDGITAACAVPTPDKTDSITLFVECKNAALADGLDALIAEKISVYAKPEHIVCVPAFPLTNVSKINVNELLKKYDK